MTAAPAPGTILNTCPFPSSVPFCFIHMDRSAPCGLPSPGCTRVNIPISLNGSHLSVLHTICKSGLGPSHTQLFLLLNHIYPTVACFLSLEAMSSLWRTDYSQATEFVLRTDLARKFEFHYLVSQVQVLPWASSY